MKNLPIKFRAKCIQTGNLMTFELGECLKRFGPDYLTVITNDVYTIDAETICQLVGYDAAGNEVYEGDTVYFKSDENKRPLRAVAGTLLIEIKHTAPEFVVKGGNLHNFIKE